MENEMFTFVLLTHTGHSVEQQYFNRRDADKRFNDLVNKSVASPDGLAVAYYCASVGGLVNAHYH